MTYQQTLDYLFSSLPMYQRVGSSAFKKDLTNTLKLCNALNNPQTKFPSIHVAGTNGKGSVSYALAAILQSAGFKVGLYISPHYKDFRERIKINGNYISQNEVIEFVAEHQSLFETIKPSFFEMTVAMAFYHFCKHKVDIAIIETGLGGRFDSTNVILPILSVITNISFDHQEMLGNTLAEIAYQKAGIIKPQTPVVIGEILPETEKVFKQIAIENNSNIYFAQHHFSLQAVESLINYTVCDVYENNIKLISRLQTDLSGIYQINNIITIFEAVWVLNQTSSFNISINNIIRGLGAVKKLTNFIGRWEVITNKPLTIADSAHNEAGIKLAVQHLKSISFEQLHIVYGTVKDKDIQPIMKLLPKTALYYFCAANIPRALIASDLANIAQSFGLNGNYYSSVQKALLAAQKEAKLNDLIVILGSCFVVAEVL